MGLLTNNDAKIFRNYFKEMAQLRGYTVKYQYPINMEFSSYMEENPQGFSEYIPLEIIFVETPKINTLKKLGWVTEIAEEKSSIAYLPFDTIQLQKGCRITLPSSLPQQKDNVDFSNLLKERIFVITTIQTTFEYPDCFICRLAPVYHTKIDTKEIDYNTQEQFIRKPLI